jgi:hypothetical protein
LLCTLDQQITSDKAYHITGRTSAFCLQAVFAGEAQAAYWGINSKCTILANLAMIATFSLQVLVKDKEHFDARFARARLYPLINEPWKAKQQYTYLLDRHPGHPEVRQHASCRIDSVLFSASICPAAQLLGL